MALQLREPARVDEETIGKREIVVAGRAGDRPALRQLLGSRQDLLDENIRSQALAAGIARYDRRREGVEAPAIALRIDQPVDMVDTQPLQDAVGEQPAEEFVRVAEDDDALHAHAGKLGDIEETAVIDLIRR